MLRTEPRPSQGHTAGDSQAPRVPEESGASCLGCRNLGKELLCQGMCQHLSAVLLMSAGSGCVSV